MLTYDVTWWRRNRLTTLHISVSKNDKKMVLLLLEHRADVNATNKCGWRAAASAHEDSVLSGTIGYMYNNILLQIRRHSAACRRPRK
jgi:hypothetical protein